MWAEIAVSTFLTQKFELITMVPLPQRAPQTTPSHPNLLSSCPTPSTILHTSRYIRSPPQGCCCYRQPAFSSPQPAPSAVSGGPGLREMDHA